MNNDKLMSSLDSWIKIETWHTSHAEDEKRFHFGLKAAFDICGTTISFDDFKGAMMQLSTQYQPRMNTEIREEIVEKFAQLAEDICSYLNNVKE